MRSARWPLFSSLDRGKGRGGEQHDDEDGSNSSDILKNMKGSRKGKNSPPRGSGRTSEAASVAAASPSTASTINLSQEYTLAVQTNSYKEIWSMIHHGQGRHQGNETGGGEQIEHEDAEKREEVEEEEEVEIFDWSSPNFIEQILQPDRESIQEALRAVPPTRLTLLVSDYLDSSEQTTYFCLSLLRAVQRARSIYAPITELLHLHPSTTPTAPDDELDDRRPPQLNQAQCDWAYDVFLQFDRLDNPFPAPSAIDGSSLQGMRGCFSELKEQLDLRLIEARRRHQAMRRATRGAAACLIASATGIALTGLALATHALVAVMAGPAMLLGGCLPTRDLLAGTRQRLLLHIAQLDAAARGVYVLDNDLDTIERLVARLHAMVESDRVLVHLGLDRGRGQRHPIEEVMRQLQKNHPSFLHQLGDLDEHIILYFTAVNRARSLLLRQIHQQQYQH